ncbi:DUF1214 domain-containing protein [Rhodococcus sp. WS3]|uniref:DUF1214 domain-containing protein n=1 Tax=Rhodococcus sp. WS3 TaxID=2486271 RepID=UPI001143B277|nr:DUF1214 domain-containing protein [Rhodococcus sp. WS3]
MVITRCPVDNGVGLPSIASNQNLTLNADGSADLYFGPDAPGDGKNWIRTVLGRGWFVALVRRKRSSIAGGRRAKSRRLGCDRRSIG